jgi:hypothetical protein
MSRHSSSRRASVRRRLPALLLQAAVVLGLLVGTTAFVTHDKTVTISVDGKSR